MVERKVAAKMSLGSRCHIPQGMWVNEKMGKDKRDKDTVGGWHEHQRPRSLLEE